MTLGAALSIGGEVTLGGRPFFVGFGSLGYQYTSVGASSSGTSIAGSDTSPFVALGAGLAISRSILLGAEVTNAIENGAQPLLEVSLRLYLAR
jgi:hypothetical protein